MKFAKVMFLHVSVCHFVHKGCAWLPGGCVVVGGVHGRGGCEWLLGAYMVARGHAWLQGVCVVAGACMVVGSMHGCWGASVVAAGHVWLLGGMHGCWGCAWLWGACVVVGGMSGCGVCAWDMTRYGQLAGGTHPTGMHSFLCNGFEFREYFCKQHIVLNHVF